MADTWSVEQTIATNKPDTRTFTYPKDTNPGLPHYIRFVALRAYTSSAQSKRGTPNGEVVLYMPPDALKTSYTQAIGDVEMGGFIKLASGGGGTSAAALAAGEFAAAGASGREAMSQFINNNLLTKEGGTKIVAGMAKAAAGGLLKKFAGTQGGQAVSRATGQILNPHKAVVYQGPGGFRTFSYTFILVPKSASEAKEIFDIVKHCSPSSGFGWISCQTLSDLIEPASYWFNPRLG